MILSVFETLWASLAKLGFSLHSSLIRFGPVPNVDYITWPLHLGCSLFDSQGVLGWC